MAPGEKLTADGLWVSHPSYGQQFAAETVERLMPETEEELISYLSSGIIKGVGPATAERLVERFGGETLAVIEEEPERLSTVKGITSKRAMEILRRLPGADGTASGHGVSGPGTSCRWSWPCRLYRTYGADALPRLRADPYLLAGERYGVAFADVDEIALSMGFGGDSPCRTEAAVLYELEHNLGNGHVFLPRPKLLAATEQLIGAPPELVEQALDTLESRGAVAEERIARVDACYLRRMYLAESETARRLLALRDAPRSQGRGVEKLIREMEEQQGIAYAPQQRQAVELAARTGVLLLTGGPGTGKTTSTRGIVALFEGMGLQVLLLAPTGRAAKRMSELCRREAQTIHRALGMTYNELTGETVFKKNGKEPLEADAVIVDEMSMVDLPLMQALLEAVKPGCRLVMVGDPDQLPSVGPGNVLGDLLRSHAVAAVSLTEVFRQAERSAIIRNAHAVNSGRPPELGSGQNDFFFLCRRAPDRLVQTVVDLCRTRLPDNMGIPADQIQVLSPTRRGLTGTVSLNRALQAALNPPAPDKRQKTWGELTFREGDRVMQTRNNYDVLWQKDDGEMGTGIFNGDVGIIQEIDPGGELVTIRFDDRTSVYTPDLLGQLDMAYAMTVHKAQGSEYRAVVLVSAPAAASLMVRGVLYTAITRARELLVMVGDDVIPGKMAENDRQARRYSGLRRRLMQGGGSDGASG